MCPATMQPVTPAGVPAFIGGSSRRAARSVSKPTLALAFSILPKRIVIEPFAICKPLSFILSIRPLCIRDDGTKGKTMLDWASMRNRPACAGSRTTSRRLIGAPEQPKPAKKSGHFAGARRRRGARLGAYRRAAGARRGRHRDQHDRRHLDRRAGRRLLSRRQARRARGIRPQPDQAPHVRPARPASRRQRPVRRHEAHAAHAGAHERPDLRGSRQAVRLRRRRNPHRPRDLAVERLADHRHARLLRAARRVRAGHLQRPRAGRRRAGQSGAGLGLPRLRAAARRRRQPALRPVRPRRSHQAQRRRTGRRTGRDARTATPDPQSRARRGSASPA